jgi:hypothetical protein
MERPSVDVLDALRARTDIDVAAARPGPVVWATAVRNARTRRRRAFAGVALAGAVVVGGGVAAAVAATRGPAHQVTVRSANSTPTSSAPSRFHAPPAAVAHTLVFVSAGTIQQVDVDTRGTPTNVPVMSPSSFGSPGSELTIAEPAINRAHTRIAFGVTDVTRGQLILVADSDGRAARPVTNGPDDTGPTWSWDGRHIAFTRRDTVWTMNADGSNQRSLGVTASPVSWSADGATLAIQSIGEPVRIGTLTIATGAVRWLTPTDGSVEQFSPAWSPDGRLVFGQRFTHNTQPGGLFVADADGADARRLTTCSSPCEDDGETSWSSDGTTIAFTRYLVPSPAEPQIYVVAAAGGPVREITSGPVAHQLPSW